MGYRAPSLMIRSIALAASALACGGSGPTGGAASRVPLALSVGKGRTCVVSRAGEAACVGTKSVPVWNGSAGTTFRFVDTSSLREGVRALALGDYHACALVDDAGVTCFGSNEAGQVGDGTWTMRESPAMALPETAGAWRIALGAAHSCALWGSGGVLCWGKNGEGQLGNGDTTNVATPTSVSGLSWIASDIAAGDDHTCVVTSARGVACWGRNVEGQLGNGSTTQSLAPVDVVGASEVARRVAVGGRQACFLNVDGGVLCWGDNRFGQLGDGTRENRSAPVDVVGIGARVNALSVGRRHVCVITTAGAVKCWGENRFGQLGDGTKTDRTTPVDVVGIASGARLVAAGPTHTCVAMVTGELKCWGDNSFGQLGDGTVEEQPAPVASTIHW
ncbi:MAG: chromosome condensation regulator RCC1 [Deltaproteobacteria bacterium]|nr:chromosome condensation regulator RCC1 [Deltaproteobacteria bacterium]